jgi:hypothetical protein
MIAALVSVTAPGNRTRLKVLSDHTYFALSSLARSISIIDGCRDLA